MLWDLNGYFGEKNPIYIYLCLAQNLGETREIGPIQIMFKVTKSKGETRIVHTKWDGDLTLRQ